MSERGSLDAMQDTSILLHLQPQEAFCVEGSIAQAIRWSHYASYTGFGVLDALCALAA